MKLTPEEVDELLSEGLIDPPSGFSTRVMAQVDDEEPLLMQVPWAVTLFRAIALLTGVGVGVSQVFRFAFGMWFIGAMN